MPRKKNIRVQRYVGGKCDGSYGSYLLLVKEKRDHQLRVRMTEVLEERLQYEIDT